MKNKALHIGDWQLDCVSGELTRAGASQRLEERTLRLLLCLASQPGEVLSADQLLAQAWPGVIVTPDSLYQAITALRRQLGDDARQPRYIATVPRRGYRLVAPVSDAGAPIAAAEPAPALAGVPVPQPVRPARRRLALALGAVLAVCGVAGVAALARGPAPAASTRSVAVLPFLDLTDDMNEEPFADGISEELIGKLSQQPGIAVAPPGASYYYKDKRGTAAEVARQLHVGYVLDGSVRRSGAALRIAARLTRAADGFVVWSDSYDRTPGDKLAIQAEIAAAVTRAAATRIQ